jgi:hypothetical protein
MAPKKEKANDLDQFLLSALQEAQKEFGSDKVYVASEHEKKQAGVFLPFLSLRWLIDSNVWPLQRITGSGGKPATFKSAFSFELERFFLEAGGVVRHIDTEQKLSSSFMRAIIPDKFFADDMAKRMIIGQATSINDWQKRISFEAERLIELVKTVERKPSFPSLWVVDSLMGSASEESHKHVQEEGQGQGRGWTDASILIANYLRDLTSTLLGLPVTLHLVNHEKDDMSGKGTRRPGGVSVDFHATVDIRFQLGDRTGEKYSGKGIVDRKDVQGKSITMSIRKSSQGPDIGRQICVPFFWWYDEQNTQRAKWDWNSATVALLLNNKSALKGVLDVEIVSAARGPERYYSSALGITKDNAMLSSEFGAALEANADVLKAAETALHIQQHQVYAAGVLD